jgi:general secretion pathway protein J
VNRRRNFGFTLAEVLVALTLFALLSSALWQGLAWLTRASGAVAEHAERVNDSLQLEWVRDLLRGVNRGVEDGRPAFTASATHVDLLSTAPPLPDADGALRLQLDLVSANGSTELRVGAAGDVAQTLLRWDGPGAFAFLDEDGQWHDSWPPASVSEEPQPGRIPRGIRIDGVPPEPLFVAVGAIENQQPGQSEVNLP